MIEQDTANQLIETKHKKLKFTIPIPEEDVSNDLSSFLKSEEFSDLIIKSKDMKIFKVHKMLLFARSPYFRAALINNMKEKQENIIYLPENDNLVEELINYIYTGKVKNIESSAKELFIAADKYQLEKLKEKCIYYLFKTVRIENAIDWLTFAKYYNCEKFENHLIKFIIHHHDEICKTDNFKSFSKTNPKLVQFLVSLILLLSFSKMYF